MRIEDDVKLDYSDVLICPKRSKLHSREDVSIIRHFTKFPHSSREWTGVPIIASNMDTIGTLKVAETLSAHSMLTCLHKHYTLDKIYEELQDIEGLSFENLMLSMGMDSDDNNEEGLKNVHQILEVFGEFISFVCIDVANGYSERFGAYVSSIRENFNTVLSNPPILVVGNVATAEMTEELILRGADVVKVGIGPGSVCTTRKVTGIGYPQLSAVIECADAAHGLDGHIIADGGCAVTGDVAKAFGAGADFVMLGGMLAGHNETGTHFYGMSSKYAQEKYNGGLKEYRASEGKEVHFFEGERGPIQETVQEILGGVRSACTYVGARELKHLPKCTTFIRVNQQRNLIFGND